MKAELSHVPYDVNVTFPNVLDFGGRRTKSVEAKDLGETNEGRRRRWVARSTEKERI